MTCSWHKQANIACKWIQLYAELFLQSVAVRHAEMDELVKKTEKKEIYHEKQRLQFCLLHALNNLLQLPRTGAWLSDFDAEEKDLLNTRKESFTRTQLDAIANELTLIDPNKDGWNPFSVVWQPHHNVLTGNYDINVLFAALEGKGKRVVWYDRRNGASSMDLTDSTKTFTGIILNKPVRKFGGLWKSRHWIALRKVDGIWYNLDSDLARPLAFEHGDGELKEFLDQSLAQGGEVLLVFEGSSSASANPQQE
eukprot:Gb_06022 [translate_table: standard]